MRIGTIYEDAAAVVRIRVIRVNRFVMALTLWVAVVLGLFVLARPAQATEGLDMGADGNLVVALQGRLTDLGLYRGPIDGSYGWETAQAVMAFHKHLGLERIFSWTEEDWRYLEVFDRPDPTDQDGLVVDLDRQVMYLTLDGAVSIFPVSSASGETYRGRGGSLVRARTPEGEFTLYRHVPGMRRSYLGALWRPWYFTGGYAIHGSSSVPAYAASHGCVRVPNWEANWLHEHLQLGMAVTVERSGGASVPELGPPPPSPLRLTHTRSGPVYRSGRLRAA